MAVVRLTPQELRHAVLVGANRNLIAIELGLRTTSKDPWGSNIRGAIAEMAVAKYLKRYWFGLEEKPPGPAKADIGNCIQVRSTSFAHGHLPVYARDPDSHLFILANTSGLDVELIGCIYGKSAKQPKWWSAEWGAFWVPRSELFPVESIENMEALRLDFFPESALD